MIVEYIYNGTVQRSTVGLMQRADGTIGPPYSFPVSQRGCTNGPVGVLELELDHVDSERNIAVYRVRKNRAE